MDGAYGDPVELTLSGPFRQREITQVQATALDIGDIQEISVRLQNPSSRWTGSFIRLTTSASASVPAYFGVGATIEGGATMDLESCSSSRTCASCGAKAGCGWCGGTNECLPGGALGSYYNRCDRGWTLDAASCPDPCRASADCASCMTATGCGWCGASCACTSVDLSGDCSDSSTWTASLAGGQQGACVYMPTGLFLKPLNTSFPALVDSIALCLTRPPSAA